jgi:hypothetical protein
MSLSSQIFFENQTNLDYQLFDIDNNFYGSILKGRQYSLVLPYSENFEKQYKLMVGTMDVLFSLSINGEINHFDTSSKLANLQISKIKGEHLAIQRSNGIVWKGTQKIWIPKNTQLIIFPIELSKPIHNFPQQRAVPNYHLPLF